MLDLVGNHIVGFSQRRLIYNIVHAVAYNYTNPLVSKHKDPSLCSPNLSAPKPLNQSLYVTVGICLWVNNYFVIPDLLMLTRM